MRMIPEGPIFELCREDRPGFRVNAPDPEIDAVDLEFEEREGIGAMSQATEIDVIRHYTRLSKFNYDVVSSCTGRRY